MSIVLLLTIIIIAIQFQLSECTNNIKDETNQSIPNHIVSLSSSSEFINELSLTNNLDSSKKALFDSPQCWKGSFEEMISFATNMKYKNNHNNDHPKNNNHPFIQDISGNSICSYMSNTHRMILALQLTKCFMTESYLPFPPECHSHMRTKEDIQDCTRSLNPVEIHSYNEFYNQIYHICTKLSQEVWNQNLLDSTSLLVQSSKWVSNHLDQMVSQHQLNWENFYEKHRIEQEEYFYQMNQV